MEEAGYTGAEEEEEGISAYLRRPKDEDDDDDDEEEEEEEWAEEEEEEEEEELSLSLRRCASRARRTATGMYFRGIAASYNLWSKRNLKDPKAAPSVSSRKY